MKKIVFTLLFIVSVFFCMTVTASAEEWFWPTPVSRMNTTWITQKYKSSHLAIDIGGVHGSDPIYASKSGTVVARFDGCTCRSEGRGGCSDNNRELGNFVIIDHGNGEYSRYCHLYYKDVAALNSYVKQGDIIGYMGSTGSSTGVHLDFRIYQGGTGIQTYSNGYGAYEQKVIGGTTLNNNPKNVYSDGNITYITTANPGYTDTEAPTISGLNVKDISGDSFTVECNLNDNVGVTRVWLVIYAPGGTYEFGDSASNGYYSKTLYTKDYGGAGIYDVRMYAFDATDNGIIGSFGEIYTMLPNQPTNLTSDQKIYNSAQSITFSWDSVPGATHYWVYMWKDGVELYNLNREGKTSFTSAPTSSGDYTFIVRAGNSIGYSSGVSYSFIVTNSVPNNVTNIRTDKSNYQSNDSITFCWDHAYGTQEYRVYLWKDGSQVTWASTGISTQYSTPLFGSGKYTFIVCPSNLNGTNESSEWYTFEVTKAPLEITCDKNVFNSTESIYFSWNSVLNATDYWVYLWKDGVELYNLNREGKTSFTSAPTSSGNYTLIVRAIGNNITYGDAAFNFTVTNTIPSQVQNIRANKTDYIPYENIVFEWDSAYGAQEYWAYLWKDGVQLTMQCLGQNTKYETNLYESGKYTLIVRPGNVNGFNDASKWYTFNVGLYFVEYYLDRDSTIYDSQTKKYENNLVISDKFPAKKGYIFSGWNTKADGSGTLYNPGDAYSINASATLYAQWEKTAPFVESTVTKNETSYNITTSLYHLPESCEVFAIGYKNNQFVTVDFLKNGVATLSGDIDTIKVMAWDSLSGLTSLCEAEVIPSSEFITE